MRLFGLISSIQLNNADDWGLLLVGMDSFNGYIQKFLKENEDCSKRICVLPPISPKEIGDYINQGDVFILPSRYDGWGIVLNEAAGIGKPLIASTMAGASWHVIKENVNGLRFKSNNIKELTNAMHYFVNNPTVIAEMGKASKQIFIDDFSATQNARRFLNILHKYGNQQ